MEDIRFIVWEIMKVLCLAMLALLAAKSVGSLPKDIFRVATGRTKWIKGALYASVAALVLLGASSTGYDFAAETYLWASQNNIQEKQYVKAYFNALRAVELRPGVLRYWRELSISKVYLRQFGSALDDKPALESLSGGQLDEGDAYRFVVCAYFLGQYDTVLKSTDQLIQHNPMFAAPYLIQGLTYAAQKKFQDAERAYTQVLQLFPNNEAGVEGLAHVFFLSGNRARAMAVLDGTATRPFSPEARKRFETLKALYVQ